MNLELGRGSAARHVGVALAIGATTALAAAGVIGGGNHPERFDAKTIVVQALDADRLRIVEYVDQDFGRHDRHGYERNIPDNFGIPQDVEAASPDAPDQVGVEESSGDLVRIRVGDPDNGNISGQHRYTLAYTLPDAQLDTLGLALNVVAPRGGIFPGDNETGRFQLLVTGLRLENTRCDTGPAGATGGCSLDLVPGSEPPMYSVVLEPLPEDAGLAVYADVVGLTTPAEVEPPPIPDRRTDRRWLLTLLMPVAGLLTAVPIYGRSRRKGSNEVFAGGAAEAAYGALPAPNGDGSPSPPAPVTLVADDRMDELATIDFAPPKGIAPWQARVLLSERIDDASVTAWFSGLAGREAITLEKEDSKLSIATGPKRAQLPPDDAALLDAVLSEGDPYITGKYDPGFARAWQKIRSHQSEQITASGWWKRLPTGAGGASGCIGPLIVLLVMGLIVGGSAATAFLGLFRTWPMAVAFGLVVPALAAVVAYRSLLPARSAHGSALALRAEAFRRFLAASEGKHVEWAWEHGLLREYSGWAVALGEADAWNDAVAGANVPEPARMAAMPILIHSMGSSINSSRTAPSSSGSSGGGGGGFSGGSGGGGGGGSSGSW